jgi:hypothetical protein
MQIMQVARSHEGHTLRVIIFVNRTPILWFSKTPEHCGVFDFWFKFVALRIAIEMIEGLRYKLRMMHQKAAFVNYVKKWLLFGRK